MSKLIKLKENTYMSVAQINRIEELHLITLTDKEKQNKYFDKDFNFKVSYYIDGSPDWIYTKTIEEARAMVDEIVKRSSEDN